MPGMCLHDRLKEPGTVCIHRIKRKKNRCQMDVAEISFSARRTLCFLVEQKRLLAVKKRF